MAACDRWAGRWISFLLLGQDTQEANASQMGGERITNLMRINHLQSLPAFSVEAWLMRRWQPLCRPLGYQGPFVTLAFCLRKDILIEKSFAHKIIIINSHSPKDSITIIKQLVSGSILPTKSLCVLLWTEWLKCVSICWQSNYIIRRFIRTDTYATESICLADGTSIGPGQSAFYLVDAINFIHQMLFNLSYSFCRRNRSDYGTKLILPVCSVLSFSHQPHKLAKKKKKKSTKARRDYWTRSKQTC